MHRRPCAPFTLCLLPMVLCAASLAGQQPAANGAIPQLRAHGPALAGAGGAGRSILLDVIEGRATGTSGEGRSPNLPRLSLKLGDLTLQDSGKRVPAGSIEEVSGGDSARQSRQVVFVLDAVNSSFAEIVRSEKALEALLGSSRDALPEPASILVVSDSEPHGKATATGGSATTALQSRQLFVHRIPPTTDRAALLQGLRDYQPGFHRILEAQAGLGQSERVRLSLEALSFMATAQATVPGAKLVIWIGPGWPYLASSAAKSSEQLFDSVVYFSDLLRDARMILYAVDPSGLSSGEFAEGSFAGPRDRSNPISMAAPRAQVRLGDTFYANFLKGAKSAKEADPNDLALQVLAIQSGGLVLQHDNDLKGLLARCAAEAESVTSLRYVPPPSDGVTRYHALSLTASGGRGQVRTRAGFYLR